MYDAILERPYGDLLQSKALGSFEESVFAALTRGLRDKIKQPFLYGLDISPVATTN